MRERRDRREAAKRSRVETNAGPRTEEEEGEAASRRPISSFLGAGEAFLLSILLPLPGGGGGLEELCYIFSAAAVAGADVWRLRSAAFC
ncbi:hypothetical protein ACLOJK_033209 [Asimina triloba]